MAVRKSFAVSVEDALRSVNVAVDDLLARLQARDEKWPSRNTRAVTDIARLDATLYAIIQLNTIRGAELSRQIAVIREQTTVLEVWLYGLSALFSVVAGLLVVRVVRRFASIAEHRVADMERLAGRMAHDIRSPLSSIGMALELTRKTQPLDEKTRTRLERSSRTVQRIGQLVDGILVFAVAGGPPPAGARAEVRQVLAGVIDEMRPSPTKRISSFASRMSLRER